jgi:hypothetical protein
MEVMINVLRSLEPLTLFTNSIRTELRPARNDEPQWAYMNISARPGIAAAREKLEDWFAHYPSDKLDLQQRFRSSIKHQHRSAFFELYVHELLRRAGYSVECHPCTTKATRPDFKVNRDGEPVFYLEAVVPRSKDEPDPGALARLNQLTDGLNVVDSPDFFLWLEHDGYPATTPSVNAVRRQIEHWLTGLDPEEVRRVLGEHENIRALPTLSLIVGGMQLTVRPIPRNKERLPHPHHRAVGATIPRNATMVDELGAIQTALGNKAKRYGKLDLPYVVAIGVQDLSVELDSAFMALLGRSFVPQPDGVILRMENRTSDGVWHDGARPHMKQVSATLIVFDPSPWNLTSMPVLIHHPWADRTMSVKDWPLDQYIPDKKAGRYRYRKGRSIRRFLGVPRKWPIPDL